MATAKTTQPKELLLTMPRILKKYGKPGDIRNLTVIELPYSMRVSWDLKSKVRRMQCHRLVAPNFRQVFEDLLLAYGLPKINKLDIDLYGGCYNFRPMRNGTNWSRHSWGIALDLSPQKNWLTTKWEDSQFSRPEYADMIHIFYKHGFINYGIEKGFDAMHWEISN